MGGNENDIRNIGKKLIEKIAANVEEKKCSKCDGDGCKKCGGTGESEERYDYKGIARQILPNWILPEITEYKFFCSELVSNLLVRCKLMNINQLKSLHNNKPNFDIKIPKEYKIKKMATLESNDLSKYDEIDPTKLYKFIIKHGEMANLVVEYKDGSKEILKPSDNIG